MIPFSFLVPRGDCHGLARGLTGLLVPASVGPEAGHEIASRSGCNVVTVLEPDPHTVGAALPGRHCSPHADLGARRCAFEPRRSSGERDVGNVSRLKEVSGGAPHGCPKHPSWPNPPTVRGGRGDPRFTLCTPGFWRTAADAEKLMPGPCGCWSNGQRPTNKACGLLRQMI